MLTRRATLRGRRLAAGLATAALLLGACSSGADPGTDPDPGDGDSRLQVVAAFYPLEYAATQVGGDAVTVTGLTEPGLEPHDLELTAAQVAQIAEADVVLYVPGFQPAIDEAVAQQAADRAVDVTADLQLLADDAGAFDPHVWLDPTNMAGIGALVADRLGKLDPAAAAAVAARADDLTARMTALDDDFTSALATCESRDLVVSHEAFGYLAAAYGLAQVGIAGLSPEAEPSPARIREVAELVAANGITTVYYETLVDPKVAQTLANESGAQTAVLDPLEGLVPDSGQDYESVMRQNLATLVAGQGCT